MKPKSLKFVALEHTSKNKMILATKRARLCQQPDAAVLVQIQALKRHVWHSKAFIGIVVE